MAIAGVQEPVEINCPFSIISPFEANLLITQIAELIGLFKTKLVFPLLVTARRFALISKGISISLV